MKARGVKRLSALFLYPLSASQNLARILHGNTRVSVPVRSCDPRFPQNYSSSSSVVPISVASSVGTRGTACPAKYC
jgi:hypothetical protein